VTAGPQTSELGENFRIWQINFSPLDGPGNRCA